MKEQDTKLGRLISTISFLKRVDLPDRGEEVGRYATDVRERLEDLAEEYLTRIWYDATDPAEVDELLAELDERTRPLFEED